MRDLPDAVVRLELFEIGIMELSKVRNESQQAYH